jgi:hypothetical protein
MFKIVMTAMLQLIFMFACTSLTQEETQKNSQLQEAQPAVASKPTQTTQITQAGLQCVRSINEFGKSTQCQCPNSQVYNPITGNCDKGGRMCTMSLTDMFNEKTGQCYTARNGCEAGDLKSIGWRTRTEKDQCQ